MLAAFKAVPRVGKAILPAQFTDESTGSPNTWLWDFGDGFTSVQQNPLHEYVVGSYTVSLTASNLGDSDSLTEQDYIVVDPASQRGHEFHRVNCTTDATGSGVEYTDVLTGRIAEVIYTKVDFANGVDFLLTNETTGQIIWQESDVNTSKTIAPRQSTHTVAGAPALYAVAGQQVLDAIVAATDRLKLEISNGGDTKRGLFDIVLG